MNNVIYVKRFDYNAVQRGEKKKLETLNGRELLKYAVFNEYGLNTDELEIKKTEHGKPYFAQRSDIHFNISHSGSYAAAAVGKYPLGVDVQVVRKVKPSLIEKLCDENEKRFIELSGDKDKAFITLWALKESYVKAIGKGLSFPLSRINFILQQFDGETFGMFSNCEGSYYVKVYEDFVLAVCSLGGAEIELCKLSECL